MICKVGEVELISKHMLRLFDTENSRFNGILRNF